MGDGIWMNVSEQQNEFHFTSTNNGFFAKLPAHQGSFPQVLLKELEIEKGPNFNAEEVIGFESCFLLIVFEFAGVIPTMDRCRAINRGGRGAIMFFMMMTSVIQAHL